jgi:hypothetical protein
VPDGGGIAPAHPAEDRQAEDALELALKECGQTEDSRGTADWLAPGHPVQHPGPDQLQTKNKKKKKRQRKRPHEERVEAEKSTDDKEERRVADSRASEEVETGDLKSKTDPSWRSGTAVPCDEKRDRAVAPVEGVRGAEHAEYKLENVAVAQTSAKLPRPTGETHVPCTKEPCEQGHPRPPEDALPSGAELLQWGDTFFSVADCLRLSAVSRAHCALAMQLWDPTLTTWSEVIESLEERLEILNVAWEL